MCDDIGTQFRTLGLDAHDLPDSVLAPIANSKPVSASTTASAEKPKTPKPARAGRPTIGSKENSALPIVQAAKPAPTPKAVTKTPAKPTSTHKPAVQKPVIVHSAPAKVVASMPERKVIGTYVVCFEPTTPGVLMKDSDNVSFISYALHSEDDDSKGVVVGIYGTESALKSLLRNPSKTVGRLELFSWSDNADAIVYAAIDTNGKFAPELDLGWHSNRVTAQLEPHLDWLKAVPGGGALTLSMVQANAEAVREAA